MGVVRRCEDALRRNNLTDSCVWMLQRWQASSRINIHLRNISRAALQVDCLRSATWAYLLSSLHWYYPRWETVKTSGSSWHSFALETMPRRTNLCASSRMRSKMPSITPSDCLHLGLVSSLFIRLYWRPKYYTFEPYKRLPVVTDVVPIISPCVYFSLLNDLLTQS